MSRFFATWFYVGLIPVAPGTFGSLAALPFGYLLHRYTGFPGLAIATLAVFLLGWWATAAATRGRRDHDPGEIVVDEVVGQWIALMPLSLGLWLQGVDPAVFPYPGWIAAFLFFRLFDIWKPWPISWADRKSTPLGVMLDDVLAGILAALCVTLLAGIVHGWLL
jgi:phosphatidylglycerophosphatase A